METVGILHLKCAYFTCWFGRKTMQTGVRKSRNQGTDEAISGFFLVSLVSRVQRVTLSSIIMVRWKMAMFER